MVAGLVIVVTFSVMADDDSALSQSSSPVNSGRFESAVAIEGGRSLQNPISEVDSDHAPKSEQEPKINLESHVDEVTDAPASPSVVGVAEVLSERDADERIYRAVIEFVVAQSENQESYLDLCKTLDASQNLNAKSLRGVNKKYISACNNDLDRLLEVLQTIGYGIRDSPIQAIMAHAEDYCSVVENRSEILEKGFAATPRRQDEYARQSGEMAVSMLQHLNSLVDAIAPVEARLGIEPVVNSTRFKTLADLWEYVEAKPPEPGRSPIEDLAERSRRWLELSSREDLLIRRLPESRITD